MTPGHAVAQDITSTFYMFITPAIEKIILEMTNSERFRKYGDNWKRMDEIDLHAYIGLLILECVFKSRGEATCSLWDAESGKEIFCAMMPLKVFHTFSRMPRYDNHEKRPSRRMGDNLAAIRQVWEKWVEFLPYSALRKYLAPLNFATFCHISGFKHKDIKLYFFVKNQHQVGHNYEVERHFLDISNFFNKSKTEKLGVQNYSAPLS